MVFKRERSYTVFVHKDLIFIDGLNHNIDVFSLDDFRFIRSLDTHEKNLACAAYINGYLLFGCQDKYLFIYDEDFKLIK
jgi:hypothetical protein